MKTFKAPWAPLTILATLVFAAFSVAVLWLGYSGEWRWFHFVPLVVFLAAAAFSVRGYRITSQAIVVQRLFWSSRVPLRSLLHFNASPNAVRGSYPVAANPGVFALVGWFRSKSLDTYRAYVTSPKHTVVLVFPRETVVVSPDDPEGFVQELSQQQSSAPSA